MKKLTSSTIIGNKRKQPSENKESTPYSYTAKSNTTSTSNVKATMELNCSLPLNDVTNSAGSGRGKGVQKSQLENNMIPTQSGIGKGSMGDIEILHTDTLLEQVENNTQQSSMASTLMKEAPPHSPRPSQEKKPQVSASPSHGVAPAAK
nr:protein EMSY-LIKE 3-like isoform X1 [Ipomoea trifida]